MRSRQSKNTILMIVLTGLVVGTPASAQVSTGESAADTNSRHEQRPFVDQEVIVTLKHGRPLHAAAVDARTSAEHLWIRYGGGRSVIRRRIHWNDIRQILRGNRSINAEEARELAAVSEEQKPAANQEHPPAKRQPTRRPESRIRSNRVTQFQFDAYLANWDRDVESDGLRLHLLPSNAAGQLQPVNGTLRVELLAERHAKYHHVHRERGLQLQRVDRWNLPVRRSQFTGEGLTISLPFRAAHPEHDTRWSNHGLVHVQLIVPGQGIYERSLDGIRVRPFAPLRDALELESHRRFLPTELTQGR
jgi:hypothetical protein